MSPRGSCTACERGGGGADHDLRFLRGLWHFCLGKFLNASSSSTLLECQLGNLAKETAAR
jgi:hypothetical protein